MNDFNNSYIQNPSQPEMSVKDWIVTLLIMAIPCVGFIMMIVWAFNEENKVRANFCKAYLIFNVVIAVLVVIFYFIFIVAMAATFSSIW
ncbi:MAG: hypothetical protein FWD82_06910 [Defluviitaleaceae bacterium]|nr:hypothetical protein [Defluviitaleaceae bacterium]